MNENQCPKCNQDLTWNGRYECGKCKTHYTKLAYCPDCDSQLEKLQACGSASYFCNGDCNELKSKSRVKFEFQPVE
ncbi:zinc ribbon domain-containing protein [Vibrio profundi]|uniref:zinc ribbon domain-containing protein n=1 Tax=Vibrio profundi TaxID=1774960 RepID=UPI003735701B